jgi:D-alanyl-D-alanine carboxypeptidase/D-alanyl-D-alanine-endopeptidase (penicillin-binding protein 4)
LVIAALLLPPSVGAAAPRRVGGIDLVWHWEAADGSSDSHLADTPINPASVVKMATTLWALEKLGAERRFETRFAIDGEVDVESSTLRGDLYVLGGGDPDFHVENAQLMAARLDELGITAVDGTLYVDDGFWIGWERGSEGTESNRSKRALLMAKRLQSAWNPRKWSAGTLREMRRYREIHAGTEFLHLAVREIGGLGSAPGGRVVASHRSNPLSVTLKRFNDFSNNDIERLGFHLGSAEAMASYYRGRWGDGGAKLSFETLSGLGSNRMTPRQIVRLMKDLESETAKQKIALSDVLPALDCGRNTLRNYPGLTAAFPIASMVGKTGTLVQTDGGVIALAGSLQTDKGLVVFFIGAPRNGARLTAARRAQARWLTQQMSQWHFVESECRPFGMRSYDSVIVAPPVD